MWIYQDSTGKLSRDGVLVGWGYSGYSFGKNNDADENISDIGPVPEGDYSISGPEDLAGGPHGPYVLHLMAWVGNKMFGRSGFLIHGDSILKPGTASRGCIILNYVIRQLIVRSGDTQLRVIA